MLFMMIKNGDRDWYLWLKVFILCFVFLLLSSTEWMEFSPYEVGMPKYGTFMRTEYFASKFFCGKLVAPYPEPPLYYLQGNLDETFEWELKEIIKYKMG